MNKNFILITVVYIAVLLYILTTYNTDVILACGIFGIINSDFAPFNKMAFNVLGCVNDSRGGDSCGVFLDGKVEYGVDKNKYYKNFFNTSELINNTSKVKIALGHCRKASVGVIDESTAQPVVLTNKDGKTTFVMLHNGTIYNYEELAAKYIPDVNIKGMTDSQVMARIFYYKGYNALQEYIGGSVFLIADYRYKNPKIFIFKGKSQNSEFNHALSEERPFYFISNKTTTIFSSIEIPLKAFMPNEEAYTIEANTLYELDHGDLYIIEHYNREKLFQTRPTPKVSTYDYYGANGYSGYNNYNGNSSTYSRYITYNKSQYSFRGKLCHGEFTMNKFGNVEDESKDTVTVYFWNGYLLYNKRCFDHLCDMWQCLGEIDLETFTSLYLETISYCSPYPVYAKSYEGVYQYCTANSSNGVLRPYTGDVYWPFTAFADSIKTGFASIGFTLESSYAKSFEKFIELQASTVTLDDFELDI